MHALPYLEDSRGTRHGILLSRPTPPKVRFPDRYFPRAPPCMRSILLHKCHLRGQSGFRAQALPPGVIAGSVLRSVDGKRVGSLAVLQSLGAAVGGEVAAAAAGGEAAAAAGAMPEPAPGAGAPGSSCASIVKGEAGFGMNITEDCTARGTAKA